jgi:hypothetical protein
MSRARPNILIVIPLLAAMGGALFIAHFMIIKRSRNAAERNTDETTVAAREQRAEPRGPGRVKLAITVPSDEGLTSVSYAVLSAEHVVVARGSAPVEAQTGSAAPPAIALPGGRGYTLSVIGNAGAGALKRATYLGSSGFDVASDGETAVSFTPGAGVDQATGESAGVATTPGASAPDGTLACQSCELSSAQGICESANITATSNTDPRTGDQTGVGWGCGTLADSKAQSACQALLHCLNVNGCGHPGENPVTGCYCGAAPAEDCIGGQGINGACIAQYQAAALASPGAPGSGAGGGQISQFIATASSDPTTPVGLANNIEHCAMETHCDACQTL